MPLDPTLGELSDQQSSQNAASMTHGPEQPGPLKGFFDYARQPVPPQTPPWQEKINQAMVRQDPHYIPPQPLPQQNWQHWIETATGFVPLVGGTLKLVRAPMDPNWPGKKFDVIHAETGEKRANVWLQFNQTDKILSLEYGSTTRGIGTDRKFGLGSNPLEAVTELQSVLPEAFREFPNMRRVKLHSVGGARREQGVGATLEYDVWKNPDGTVGWKRVRESSTRPGAGFTSSMGTPTAQPPSAQRRNEPPEEQ